MFSPNQGRLSPFSQRKKHNSPEASISDPALQNDLPRVPGDVQEDGHHHVEAIIGQSQKLQDDLKKQGCKINHHEENLNFLKTRTKNLEESILDMQVRLGNYHLSNFPEVRGKSPDGARSEEQIIGEVLKQEKTAAGILCQLKFRQGSRASQIPLTKDVLGIVATLGRVSNDNLSRVFSEYLGLETMMAVVCKTYDGVQALEVYDKESQIDQSAGLHGLGSSIGRPLEGRFLVICLEDLRPYVGELLTDDPQKKLALLKPRLPNGECARGFIDFAVNMIHLDNRHLSYVTASGYGLRETLFYAIFSRVQVYKTRVDMQLARPCITDGAVSLDGGMIKGPGMFFLGSRKDLEVRFPVGSGQTNIPTDIIETEEQVKFMVWEKERILEDMQREEALLQHAKNTFDHKKDEFMQFLTQASSRSPFGMQNQGQTLMR